MATYTHDFNARYDFQKKSFDGSQDDCHPMFYLEKQLDKDGNLIEVEMVKVQQPNERLNVFGGRVTDVHRHRWPRHYEAFKKNDVLPIEGTPLAKWPEVAANIEFLDSMKALGLVTVENMANMNDRTCQTFHGGLTWRKRAQVYLEEQEKIKEALLRTTVSDQSERVAELEAKLKALTEQMSQPKKRGPKPKNQEIAA